MTQSITLLNELIEKTKGLPPIRRMCTRFWMARFGGCTF